DFANVSYTDGGAVDAQLGVPGLHTVNGKVEFSERQTILPPDLYQRFAGRTFWRRPRANMRNVAVVLPSEQRARRLAQQAGGHFAPDRSDPPVPASADL
ncbi:MAG: hypothetical protein KGJ00_20785, partial [Bradyrhizobium sp.]|nr:hypothetical protein [Bradyrhizobium sp.]